MLAHTDMLEEAGYTEVPDNWDDVREFCQIWARKHPDSEGSITFDWRTPHRFYWPYIGTLRAEGPFDANGLSIFEGAEAEETMFVLNELASIGTKTPWSRESFIAGTVPLLIDWPTALMRVIQAHGEAGDAVWVPFPRNKHECSIFWSCGFTLPTYSAHKEMAAYVWEEFFLDRDVVKQGIVENYKQIPVTWSAEACGDQLPDWYPGALNLIGEASPIPMNPYFQEVSRPVWQDHIDRMIAEGEDPENVLADINADNKKKAADIVL
jgi:ABC-type glycerol-3-phosphate transport system substrate-binding protein